MKRLLRSRAAPADCKEHNFFGLMGGYRGGGHDYSFQPVEGTAGGTLVGHCWDSPDMPLGHDIEPGDTFIFESKGRGARYVAVQVEWLGEPADMYRVIWAHLPRSPFELKATPATVPAAPENQKKHHADD